MAYPPTLTDLQNDVLSRLSETDASHAGDFLPGDNRANPFSAPRKRAE